MTKKRVFQCHGYISLSVNNNGILYPVYRTGKINWSYVQETDRDGMISAFMPFFDFEHFSYVPATIARERQLDDEALFAFFDEHRSLREITYGDAQKIGRDETSFFAEPNVPVLTRMALARLSNAPLLTQMDCAAEFGRAYLGSLRAQELFAKTANRLIEERRRIWDRIEATELPQSSVAGGAEFKDFETEELYRWLFDSPHSEDWTVAFTKLLKRVSFEDRILDLVVRLMTRDGFELDEAQNREKAIVARGIETYAALGIRHSDFEDIMHDVVFNGSIFVLEDYLDIRIILDFINKMDEYDVLTNPVIDVYMEGVARPDLSGSLALLLLDRILDSAHLDLPYPSNAIEFEGPFTRRHRLKLLVDQSPRIALALPANYRSDLSKYLR